MAWVEDVAKRAQRSKTYTDDTDQTHHVLHATLAALHYESKLDSGVYDAQVDFAPVRVQTPALDGWRIEQAGWHFALGQPGDKQGDGWVGYGGRQGAHWLQFRLTRLGWCHWPTLDFDVVGGAPSYNRANLSQSTRTVTIGPSDDMLVLQATVTWAHLWTPGTGGDLSISWRAYGDGLKELVTINQAARTALSSTWPGTHPATETYFVLGFLLDATDIPRWVKQGFLQSITDIDDDASDQLELRDTLDNLLGFMPVADLMVGGASVPLRKRIYTDGDSNVWLLVGVRADVLNGLPSGDLVFDPTLNPQVGVGSDDARESGGTVNLTSNNIDLWNTNHYGGWRFTNIGLDGTETINSASYLDFYMDTWLDLDWYVNTEQSDDAATFTTDSNNISNRWTATGQQRWTNAAVPGGWRSSVADSVDISSCIQAVIDRAGWSTDNAIAFLAKWISGDCLVRTYEFGTTYAAKLYIDYSAGGGPAVSIPVIVHHLRQQGMN